MIEASLLDRVTNLLAEMPGVGKKSAQRLAFFILNQPDQYAEDLADAVTRLKANLRWCTACFNISHQEVCDICAKQDRDRGLLCVVEDAANLATVERSGGYRGYYHVLQGVLSPVNGIGPEELRVRELLERLRQEPVEEVILATNPTLEGEATAGYLADLLAETGIAVSRIGVGVPIGGSLDYCDEVTMSKALENRRRL